MRLLTKALAFLVVFSGLFFLLRTWEDFNRNVLLADIADLGGVPWLYSTVGVIFSILAAFIIQNEWQQWSNLVQAVRGELESLQQLWLCAVHFPDGDGAKLNQAIYRYLSVIGEKGLHSAVYDDQPVTEDAFAAICDAVYGALEKAPVTSTAVSILDRLAVHRGNRLLYSLPSTPGILKNTLGFAASIVIVLSLFIGVENMWLDYVFTTSIAVLAWVIYLVVDDLDNPLRPGIWQLTPQDYRHLLKRLQSAPKRSWV